MKIISSPGMTSVTCPQKLWWRSWFPSSCRELLSTGLAPALKSSPRTEGASNPSENWKHYFQCNAWYWHYNFFCFGLIKKQYIYFWIFFILFSASYIVHVLSIILSKALPDYWLGLDFICLTQNLIVLGCAALMVMVGV